jgi:hypothetical protein
MIHNTTADAATTATESKEFKVCYRRRVINIYNIQHVKNKS